MQPSALENFLLIALKPDNMPIGGMLFIVAFVFWIAIRQMIKHDRLIKEGKKEKIFDEMIK
ncbi:conserved hypothetical protein [Nitrospina gracilis 3/211]|uniref:Uncharacterized protein n=1 Tax=Nitrospina gracilis (strain 3/211) TaxID=1266370 RepID=M1Z1T9_NITG3|nr:hypothetical protein [Nitrospina sp. Nb-3]MCF8724324.1 hypothetical protein [Nitrospina sp. Nb-3]CCQ91478.1 conserved hypothetical protein [Nitrospina gracilis 3/211]